MSLPSGYVELEYIESTGTQYFDTGFQPNNNTRVVLDASVTSGSGNVALFGARTSATSNNYALLWSGTSTLRSDYNNAYSQTWTVDRTTRRIYDKNKETTTIDGVSQSYENATFQTPWNLMLLASNINGAVQMIASAKVYSCQIYDNGLLARDFIPAKTIEGEIGLYDRVYHEFYRNAGSGTFTAGPEMEREDYTELEYVESSGTRYIDSGVVPNEKTRVVCDLLYTQTNTYQFAFGSRTSSSSSDRYGFMLYGTNQTFRTDFGSNVLYFDASVTGLSRQKVDKNGNVCTVGGVSLTNTAATISGSYPMFVFALNNGGTASDYAYMKLYSCQIYDNGSEIRVYIPMLHPSGVAGLWDTVNERFYASATTTDFIAGPEAVKELEAPTNFRVESETDSEVVLAWNETETAAGYLVRQSGMVIADTTELTVTAGIQLFGYYTFEVSAYNEYGESERSALAVFRTPDNPLLWLVTDRTAQDVADLNDKGVYNSIDLNRVGSAVNLLKHLLESAGFAVKVSPVISWEDSKWMSVSQAARYLADIEELRSKQAVLSATPQTPASMSQQTYAKANHIEQILLDVYAQYLTMLTTRVAAGTATSGGDYL